MRMLANQATARVQRAWIRACCLVFCVCGQHTGADQEQTCCCSSCCSCCFPCSSSCLSCSHSCLTPDRSPLITQAHTATYRALKALPGGADKEIGLVHHHITFAAQGKGLMHLVAE